MVESQSIGDDTESIRDLIEAVPVGVVIIDASGAITLVNGELERMFLYQRAALIGQPIELLLPERHRAAHSRLRSQYLANPSRRVMGVGRELFGVRSDGSEFPVEIGLNGIRTKGGLLATASIVDISARRESESTFRSIVESAPYGLVMADRDGLIIAANAHMTRLFGYSHSELLGKAIELLVPARHREAHTPLRMAYDHAPSVRAMGANRDLTGQHKDGTEFPVEIGLSPTQWNGQNVSLATVIDISVRKRLELDLRDANARLDEFSYVASHDLKSPLRGINNLVEWLGEGLQDNPAPEVQRNLGRIQTRVARMERIIDDLLLYARARAGTSKVSMVDPGALIAELLELETVPPGFNVSFEVTAEPFMTVQTPLETVLRNLIGNAIKHHDRPVGQIEVKVFDDQSYCHIEVSDDGPGIPTSAQTRVFKLFQTASSAQTGGSGVGLAISKRLVESHGGKITLESRDDVRGSTFHILWPRFERRRVTDSSGDPS